MKSSDLLSIAAGDGSDHAEPSNMRNHMLVCALGNSSYCKKISWLITLVEGDGLIMAYLMLTTMALAIGNSFSDRAVAARFELVLLTSMVLYSIRD